VRQLVAGELTDALPPAASAAVATPLASHRAPARGGIEQLLLGVASCNASNAFA